ncbi:MAG: hypothetical protein AABZ32_03115, partial [Bacteroidota bacterium]
DGTTLKLLEAVNLRSPKKVIVTFVDDLDDGEQVREYVAQTNSFSFWSEPAEDLYQDYLKKDKK